MMMKRRSFLTTSLATAAVATMPKFCFAAPDKSLKVWAPPAIPAIVLSVLKHNSKNPVEFELYKGPDMLRAGLASNSMSLLLTPTYVAANFYNHGTNLRMLDLVTNGFFYIMSRDKNLHNIEELSGKKITVIHPKNTMPDNVLRVLLQAAKIEDKVEVFNVPSSNEAMTMFLNKQIDTCLIVEPQASVIAAKAKATGDEVFYSMDIQQEWGRLFNTAPSIPMVSLVTEHHFYEENREAIQELRKNLADAVSWTKQNISKAAEFGQKDLWPKFTLPVLENALTHGYLTFESPDKYKENLLFYYDKLYQLNPKLIGGKIPNDDFFKV